MNPIMQFPSIASKIIREQEFIIGSLAWDEARNVEGLKIVDQKKGEVSLEDADSKNIIDALVMRYERIFGHASHEVCRESVRGLIAEMSKEEIPSSLR